MNWKRNCFRILRPGEKVCQRSTTVVGLFLTNIRASLEKMDSQTPIPNHILTFIGDADWQIAVKFPISSSIIHIHHELHCGPRDTHTFVFPNIIQQIKTSRCPYCAFGFHCKFRGMRSLKLCHSSQIMPFMLNHVIHVISCNLEKSCHSCQIMSNHVIHVKSCHSSQIM
jgi:hypothetical protein